MWQKKSCTDRLEETGDEDYGIVEDWAIQSTAGRSAPSVAASCVVQ